MRLISLAIGLFAFHLAVAQSHHKGSLHDPRNANLITTDIDNFWIAYDSVQKDTSRGRQIFQELYFDKGTKGLNDYFRSKIQDIDKFVANQQKKPLFYKAIRNNTLSIDSMKENIYQAFEKLQGLYADAKFPDIYFLIGRWSSGGTVSGRGLLLGTDQLVKTPDIPLGELNIWEYNNFRNLEDVPVIV